MNKTLIAFFVLLIIIMSLYGQMPVPNGSGSGSGSGSSNTYGALSALPETCTTGDTYRTSDSRYEFLCSASAWVTFYGGKAGSRPTTTVFSTTFNIGSATIEDSEAGLYIRDVENSYELHGVRKSTLGANFTATISGLRTLQTSETSKYPGVGIVVSDGTKYIVFEVMNNSGAGYNGHTYVAVESFTDAETYSATVLTPYQIGVPSSVVEALRIVEDASNRTYYFSVDGIEFEQVYQEAKTTFLTTSSWGIAVKSASSASQVVSISVPLYSESTP